MVSMDAGLNSQEKKGCPNDGGARHGSEIGFDLADSQIGHVPDNDPDGERKQDKAKISAQSSKDSTPSQLRRGSLSKRRRAICRVLLKPAPALYRKGLPYASTS